MRITRTRCRCAVKPCSANAICARALVHARNCGCAVIRYRNKFCMSSPSPAEPQAEPQTLMAHLLDGKVATAPVSEYGKTEVEVDTASKLFTGVSPKTICWILLSCLA